MDERIDSVLPIKNFHCSTVSFDRSNLINFLNAVEASPLNKIAINNFIAND